MIGSSKIKKPKVMQQMQVVYWYVIMLLSAWEHSFSEWLCDFSCSLFSWL